MDRGKAGDFAPGFIECWHAYSKSTASPNERPS
jgi:hypothetical protein